MQNPNGIWNRCDKMEWHVPILSLRCMHCDMWGNCKIFRHFLLLPLLLSDPPAIAKRQQKKTIKFPEGKAHSTIERD